MHCIKKSARAVVPLAGLKVDMAATKELMSDLQNSSEALAAFEKIHSLMVDSYLRMGSLSDVSEADTGQYSWISANVLSNRLQKNKTLAFLEIGDNYAKLAYQTGRDEGNTVQLFDQTHKIFSQSETCIGRHYAFYRW